MGTEIGDLGLRLLGASDSAVMILTCPDCATSYFVDEAKIPPQGRTVRCANCGARWQAEPEAPLTIDDLLDEAAVEITEEPPPPEPEPEPAPVVDDGQAAAARRAQIRAEAEAAARRRRKALVVNLSIWGGMAAMVAGLLVAAVLLRVDVVRLWPRTAGAYAAVGLPVNTIGLEIQNLKVQPTLQDGHAAMAVSGALQNVADHAVVSPPLRLRMLDSEGRTLTTNIAHPADATVPKGQSRHFAIIVLDTPVKAKILEVGFAPPTAAHDQAEAHGKTEQPLPMKGGHASEPHG